MLTNIHFNALPADATSTICCHLATKCVVSSSINSEFFELFNNPGPKRVFSRKVAFGNWREIRLLLPALLSDILPTNICLFVSR